MILTIVEKKECMWNSNYFKWMNFECCCSLRKWRSRIVLWSRVDSENFCNRYHCLSGCVVAVGWVIGVLEAVILVLVVGLSFDFTLHYGASVPPNGCAIHRVQEAAQKSGVPIGLAAFSSVVAGGAMLFAETHAFFQVWSIYCFQIFCFCF